MSHFLFVMFEGGGNAPVQLAIARRLVSRGHAVRVLGDPALEPQVRAASCEFAAFATAPHHNMRDREHDIIHDWAIRSPRKRLARFATELAFGPAERYARDVLGELERHPADAIAVDCLLYGAMIAAERSGLPTAQLFHMPYSLPSPGVPPFGMGFRPARGLPGRLRDRALGALATRMFEELGREPVNAARAALGMAPLASVFDQARRQNRVLVLTTKGFDFSSKADLPANVTYVGPQTDDPSWVEPWTAPWPDHDTTPLVLVALGSTYQAQVAPLQRVVDALAALPVRGLVTTGGAFPVAELRVPHNVVAVSSAPHREILPSTTMVVAHGGHGTVMKALAHGKPVLCIPLGRDQTDNAARVEESGAGLRAKPGDSARSLRAKLRRLLEQRRFAHGAAQLATEIATDVAADRAVTEMETLATSSSARSTSVLTAALACCMLAACGSGSGSETPPDAMVDADVVGTINDVECGPLPPIGPGNVAELQRHVLDSTLFPDALCNDGTPATLYFRPYNGAANRNKWVINLRGGGTCSGGASCLARWCGCTDTDKCPYTTAPTNFSRLTMTNAGPSQKRADGIFLRGGSGAQTNPYGDYNQVQLSYCSSDAWKGRARSVAFESVHPVSGEPVAYTAHFLGASVLAADLTTLRQSGAPGLVYTLAGASVPLPDLDEASDVIVVGDSAGGAGVIANLDSIATTLRSTNVNCQGSSCPLDIVGLIDAVVGPDWSKLDFQTFLNPAVRSYDDYLTMVSTLGAGIQQQADASCLAGHTADPRPCHDDSHVIRHHITTPFFVRMALRDVLISRGYLDSMVRTSDLQPMTLASFALTLHRELSDFEFMLTDPDVEERGAMTFAPGVFAPGCSNHDTILDTSQTYQTTITPDGGSPLRVLQVFDNWLSGRPLSNVLTQSTTLDDTVCP